MVTWLIFLAEITLNSPISSVWIEQLNCNCKNMTFKLYCTIFASIFFFQFKEAIFTDYKSSLDVSNGILSFANLFSFPNYLLNATPFESLFVYGEQDCLQACTENPRCRSLNFKGSKLHGKFLCNLLDTDKFKSLKLFGGSLDFHHFSVTVSILIKKILFWILLCVYCVVLSIKTAGSFIRKDIYLFFWKNCLSHLLLYNYF